MSNSKIGQGINRHSVRDMDLEELRNVLDKHRGEIFQHTFYRIFDDPGFEREEILTDDLITYFLDKAADRKLTWYECFGEKYKIVSIDTYNNEETIKILLYRH